MVVAQQKVYEYQEMPDIQHRPRTRAKKRNRIKPLLMVAFMFLVFSALIARYVNISEANYELAAMKKELAQLQKTNDELKLQLTLANNIDNIERIASTKLHMHYPDPSQTVYVHIAPENNSATQDKKVADSQQHKSIWTILYNFLD